MKRAIGIPLLLLANIVILAHAVIPHHHHSGMVVSVCDLFSIDDAIAHQPRCGHIHASHYSADIDNHDHSGKSDEDCILSDLYARFNQDRQQQLSSDDADSFHHIGYIYLFAVAPIERIELEDYGNLLSGQQPYVFSLNNEYITRSLGLRAPPSC